MLILLRRKQHSVMGASTQGITDGPAEVILSARLPRGQRAALLFALRLKQFQKARHVYFVAAHCHAMNVTL
jgi:hypothetical protein